MTGSGAVLRRAVEADRAELYEICVRTGDAGRDARPLLHHHELYGHLWAGQYLACEPQRALVAEVDGRVVGYVLGALDTASFEARLERDWWPALQARYPLPGSGTTKDVELIARLHRPDRTPRALTERYPSHLHIDLLSEGQGRGLGRALMDEMFTLLAAAGSPGVHLGVDRRNTQALGFYEHLGLRRHDHPTGILFTHPFPRT